MESTVVDCGLVLGVGVEALEDGVVEELNHDNLAEE